MIDHSELVRRAVTISQSRHRATIFDSRCEYYILGDLPPHYPVPAVKTLTEYIPVSAYHPAAGSLTLWNVILCPGCGEHYAEILACLWDFNPERCKNNFMKCGEYTNRRQVEEIAEVLNMLEEGAAVQ